MEAFAQFMEMMTVGLSVMTALILLFNWALGEGKNQDEEWACYKAILFAAAVVTAAAWIVWGIVAFRDLEQRGGVVLISFLGAIITGIVGKKCFNQALRAD